MGDGRHPCWLQKIDGHLDGTNSNLTTLLYTCYAAEDKYRITCVQKEEMQEMKENTWRKFLENIIADGREKQRIANELGVNPVTLSRWVTGETNPRQENLRRLFKALPAHRETLTRLIREEYPAFDIPATGDEPEQIPAEIYRRILNMHVNVQESQRSWYLADLILQLALGQLDPDGLGMALTIAYCMPPSGPQRKVRSLRQSTGRGTSPWNTYLDREPLFLGIESLAGYAISTGHLIAVQSREEESFIPIRWEKWEESAIASPIHLAGRFAGCLIVSSTQPEYFLPFRQKIVEQYTELLTLAFRSDEFYTYQDIELGVMPSLEIQQRFRQKVSDTLREALRGNRLLTSNEAEQIVWTALEAELLDMRVADHM